MELMQLEYFIETARREHISRTAEALNLTQPALSKSISRLEEDLGVKLFNREGKNIRLNQYGKVALRYAEQIFYNIGDMRAEIEELRGGMAGALRIGSSFPAQEPNWLLGGIREFSFLNPDVSISLRQLPPEALLTALQEREIDLAVSSEPIQAQDVCWQELFSEPMGIILSRDHPLARHKTLSMDQLMNERFYCNNYSSDVSRLTRMFCRMAGFEPNIHFEGDYPTFIGQSVSLGYGISFISQRGFARDSTKKAREPWEENIVYRPVREDYCRRACGLAHLKSHGEFPVLRHFRDTLLEQFHDTES